MNIIEITKPAFFVIGKEGYGNTVEGNQWIIDLWKDANQHFLEVFDLASRDEQDHLRGFWGAMTDSTRSFLPWKDLNDQDYQTEVIASDVERLYLRYADWNDDDEIDWLDDWDQDDEDYENRLPPAIQLTVEYSNGETVNYLRRTAGISAFSGFAE